MTNHINMSASQNESEIRLLSVWFLLMRNQLFGFLREPAAAGFNVAVPFFILLIQAAAFGETLIGKALPGYRIVDILPVTAAVMFVMIIGVFGMGVGLAAMIETKTIAVYRLRPGGLTSILSAFGAVLMIVAVVGLTSAIIVLHLIWSLRAPNNLALFSLAVMIGYVLFLAIGAFVGSISGTPRAAQGLASAIFFPMLFLSGAIIPLEAFPGNVQTIAAALPGNHLNKLLSFAWIVSNDTFPTLSAVYLIFLAVVFVVAAVKVLSRREQL